jgi:hypothetical protein
MQTKSNDNVVDATNVYMCLVCVWHVSDADSQTLKDRLPWKRYTLYVLSGEHYNFNYQWSTCSNLLGQKPKLRFQLKLSNMLETRRGIELELSVKA